MLGATSPEALTLSKTALLTGTPVILERTITRAHTITAKRIAHFTMNDYAVKPSVRAAFSE